MIEIEHVSKSFMTPCGIKKVLDDISLEIRDGVFLGIKGESGAGKSTLVSIIAGLQKPDSGKIIINKTDFFSLSDDEICCFRNKSIGFVSQEQSFLQNLTVLENVMLPAILLKDKAIYKNEAIGRTKKLLSDFGIDALSEMSPSVLSGGEIRRGLIARALINDPKILVADEPTEAVSRIQTKQIIGIFKQLSSMGKTIILVSHDEDSLEQCDDVLNLEV